MGAVEDSKKFRDFAIAFLKEAKEDVDSAEDLLGYKRYSRIVYFCQQCTEKSVKALLEMERIFAAEHDLSTLFVRFIYNNKDYKNLKGDLDIIRENLEYFKGEWIKTRYPKEKKGRVVTPSELYEENDAILSIEKAKEVLKKVKEIFDKKFFIKTNDNEKSEDKEIRSNLAASQSGISNEHSRTKNNIIKGNNP